MPVPVTLHSPSPYPQNTSVANVSVIGCLSHFVRARVLEDGSCSGGVRLAVNTTTLSSGGGSGGGRKDNVTNLPYPEPGDWYLTLAVRCYQQQLYGRYVLCSPVLVLPVRCCHHQLYDGYEGIRVSGMPSDVMSMVRRLIDRLGVTRLRTYAKPCQFHVRYPDLRLYNPFC